MWFLLIVVIVVVPTRRYAGRGRRLWTILFRNIMYVLVWLDLRLFKRVGMGVGKKPGIVARWEDQRFRSRRIRRRDLVWKKWGWSVWG